MDYPFAEHPGQRGGCGCNLCDRHRHPGNTVRSQLTARIKAEPPDPQHSRPHQRVTQIVGGHCSSRITLPFAEYQRSHQAGHAGIDMNDRTASEIENAVAAKPTTTPNPMTNRRIDHQHPNPHEPQHCQKLHSFCKCTHNQRGSNDGKRHLEGHEHRLGDRARHGINRNSFKERFTKTAPPRPIVTECNRITD